MKVAKTKLPSISIYIVIFIALSFALSGSGANNDITKFEAKKLSICIEDEDHSTASKAITSYLKKKNKIKKLKNDQEVLTDNLYYQNISYVLIIPKGYEENLKNGNVKNIIKNLKLPNTYNAALVEEEINQYITSLTQYLKGGFTFEESLSKADLASSEKTNVTLKSFTNKTSEGSNIYYFFLYLPYVFIMALLCSMCPVLSTFKNKEIKARMACSCVPLLTQNNCMLLGVGVFSFIIYLIFIVLSAIFYPTDFFTKAGIHFMENSFVFLLISITLVFLISLFQVKEEITSMIANVVGLGSSFLGGIFVPQSVISPKVLSVSKYLPTYWYVKDVDLIAGKTSETFTLATHYRYIFIQLLFCLSILIASLVISKIKQEQKSI